MRGDWPNYAKLSTDEHHLTGIPQRHISEMENGKRGIGKERARKIAEALHVSDYRFFL